MYNESNRTRKVKRNLEYIKRSISLFTFLPNPSKSHWKKTTTRGLVSYKTADFTYVFPISEKSHVLFKLSKWKCVWTDKQKSLITFQKQARRSDIIEQTDESVAAAAAETKYYTSCAAGPPRDPFFSFFFFIPNIRLNTSLGRAGNKPGTSRSKWKQKHEQLWTRGSCRVSCCSYIKVRLRQIVLLCSQTTRIHIPGILKRLV